MNGYVDWNVSTNILNHGLEESQDKILRYGLEESQEETLRHGLEESQKHI